MILIRKFVYITLLTAFLSSSIYAQQSDYEVSQNFEHSVEDLREQILNTASVEKAEKLGDKVDSLKNNYESNKEILNHALYPSTFSGVISDLKRELSSHEQKLQVIEKKTEELSLLSNRINAYKNEITFINSQADSLRNVIQNTNEDKANLESTVAQYRSQIERRDEMVLNMIDSLLVTFNEFEGQFPSELGEEMKSRALANQSDPLKYIEVLIEDNISTLKHHQDNLTVKDYLRMYVVQQRFEQVWEQIGDELTNLYGKNNAQGLNKSIDGKIQDWEASASRNMWASLNEYLEENEINLAAFDNNQSFYAALDSFIDNEINSSRNKILKDEFHEEFKAFYEIWNKKIKDDWGKFVEDGEVLTMNQISTIDAEIMDWKSEVEPRSLTIPIILGLSLMTIVGLIVALARKK